MKKFKKNINSACYVVNLQSASPETLNEHVRDSDLIIDINSDAESYKDDQKSLLSSEYNFEHVEKLIEVSKQFQKDYENERVKNGDSVVLDENKLNIQVLSSRSSSLISRPIPTFDANQQHNDVDNYYFSNCTSKSKKENIFNLGCLGSSQHKRYIPKISKPGPFGTGIIRPSPKKHSCVQKKELTTAATIKRCEICDGYIKDLDQLRNHMQWMHKVKECTINPNDASKSENGTATYKAIARKKRSVDGSCRVAWNIRPYSARYYNFERTHPHLQLIENGNTIIPKRILKGTNEMTEQFTSTTIKKPLMNKGLTWHEFFERGNVYSAKSLQSSYGDCQTHTTSTQTVFAESSTTRSNETNTKIQKHILPQLNIPAECSVQQIPYISIAPNALQHIVKSNIKLVEIIYDESDNSKTKGIEPVKECIDSTKEDECKIVEQQHYQSESEYPSPNDFENAKISESKISFITPSNTSLSNHGSDSSLKESTSLNVSRLSDYETGRRLVSDTTIQNQKMKRFAKHRKGTNIEQASMSSSDCSDFEYDGKHLIEPQQSAHGDMMNVNLPTFPTNELIQMVDEIFDTSSDGCTDKNVINMSGKHVVKETSVQTDIVWQNINEFLRQQGGTIQVPATVAVENKFTENFARSAETIQSNVINITEVDDGRFVNTVPLETNDSAADILLHKDVISKESCRHSHIKKFKICSCLHCKNNIRFSVMNINQSSQSHYVASSSSSSVGSSSPVVKIEKPKASAKTNLFPSERYKQMKQAQREHFESDPRISKTLKKIYAAARAVQSPRNETTSSSSSNHFHMHRPHPERSNNFFVEDETLQPDLYTFSDEVLLFGYSTDEIHYSSYLLKTESSQDTSTSNERFCGVETSKDVLLRNRLMCTNSEDSSSKSFDNKRGSDLERDLLKDIENSWSDPAVLSSVFSTSSLERKINEIQLNDQKCK